MPNNILIPTFDLPKAYRNGNVIGAFLDTDNLPSDVRRMARYSADKMRAEQPFPLFATAPRVNWGSAGTWKGKRALLWKAWSALDADKALKGAQVTGDCVSWGERCKQEVTRCVEIVNKGEREVYRKRQATCLLYSGRGHTGEGASATEIANWATKCGILLEDVFTDSDGKKWDFTEYQNYVKYGINYGSRGMPQSIISITSAQHVMGQSVIKTTDELCDVMFQSGKAASIAFSLDTADTGNPVSRLSGRTAHQTCMVGFDDTPEARAACKRSLGYEDTIIFYDQSWGNWNNVTGILPDWEPWGEGMYCHSARDAQRHIDEGECIVCTGSIKGFEAGPLNNMLI